MLHQARVTFPVAALALSLSSLLLSSSPSRAAEPTKGAGAPASAAPAVADRPQASSVVTIRGVSDRDYRDLVVAPHKGKVVLVTFWASYCAPCLEELPGLLEMKKKLAARGVEILFVNVDPPGDEGQIQKIARTRRFPPFETLQVTNDDPQLFIDAVDKQWAGEVPYAVVYGRDGALQKALSGEQKLADFEKAIDEVSKRP